MKGARRMGLNWLLPRTLLGYGQEPYGLGPYGTGQKKAQGSQPQFNPGPGYTVPEDVGGELNDKILRRLLQQIVSGISGLPGNLVYPRWQPEPPNQPDFTVDWAALGITSRTRDVFVTLLHTTYPVDPTTPDAEAVVTDTVNRNEILSVLCSFYGPNSEAYSEKLAMGLMLEQNRYVMFLNGMALVDVGETLTVPAKDKERWLMGQDVSFRLRRQQNYTYSSGNVESFEGTLITDAESVALAVNEESHQ